MTQRRFGQNALWLTVKEGASVLLTLIVGVFTARYLGPSGYGLLSYGASFVSVFAAVCRLGLDSSLTDALVARPGDAGRLLGSAMGLRMLAAALSQFGLALAVSIAQPGNRALLIVTLLQGVALFFDARDALDIYFQSRLESRYSAFAGIAGVLALCAIRVMLLLTGAPVEAFALATGIQGLVSLAVSFSIFRRRAGVRLSFSLAEAGHLVRSGAYFMLAGLASTVYFQIDRLMIGGMLTDSDVGQYAVASYVALVGRFAADALIITARPLLLAVRREDSARYAEGVRTLLAGVLTLGVFLGAALFFAGPMAVRIVYGEAYAPAGRALSVLCLSVLFSTLNRVRDLHLLAEGLSRYCLVFVLGGAACNIGLNLLMIPRWGVSGAALATMCAYAVTALVAPALFPRTRPYARMLVTSPARVREASRMIRTRIREGRNPHA